MRKIKKEDSNNTFAKKENLYSFFVVLLQIFKLWYLRLYHDRRHSKKRGQFKEHGLSFRHNVLTLDSPNKKCYKLWSPLYSAEEDCSCVKILVYLVRPNLLIACTCRPEKHHLSLLLQLHINLLYAMTNEHVWFPSLTPWPLGHRLLSCLSGSCGDEFPDLCLASPVGAMTSAGPSHGPHVCSFKSVACLGSPLGLFLFGNCLRR